MGWSPRIRVIAFETLDRFLSCRVLLLCRLHDRARLSVRSIDPAESRSVTPLSPIASCQELRFEPAAARSAVYVHVQRLPALSLSNLLSGNVDSRARVSNALKIRCDRRHGRRRRRGRGHPVALSNTYSCPRLVFRWRCDACPSAAPAVSQPLRHTR